MAQKFKPQETSMNSMQKTETELYNTFRDSGFSDVTARAVAHTFTQFMLSYVTEEGAAQALVKAGASESLARALVAKFSAAKAKSLRATPREFEMH